VPTTVCHLSLPRARLIHSTHFHLVPLKFILILSSLLRLGVSIGIRPSDFPAKTLYALSSDSDVTHSHPSRPPVFGHPHNIIRDTQNGDGHYMFNFLQAPLTPPYSCRNIFLSSKFWDSLSLNSALNTEDRVPHPRDMRGRIIFPLFYPSLKRRLAY